MHHTVKERQEKVLRMAEEENICALLKEKKKRHSCSNSSRCSLNSGQRRLSSLTSEGTKLCYFTLYHQQSLLTLCHWCSFSWTEDKLSVKRKHWKVKLQMKMMTGNPWQSFISPGFLSSYVIVFQFSKLSFYPSLLRCLSHLTQTSPCLSSSLLSLRALSDVRADSIKTLQNSEAMLLTLCHQLPSIQVLKMLE